MNSLSTPKPGEATCFVEGRKFEVRHMASKQMLYSANLDRVGFGCRARRNVLSLRLYDSPRKAATRPHDSGLPAFPDSFLMSPLLGPCFLFVTIAHDSARAKDKEPPPLGTHPPTIMYSPERHHTQKTENQILRVWGRVA